MDEVPAKRQFYAVTFAALLSGPLSRLRRDARCKGFAKAFPAQGGKKPSRCLWQKKRGLLFRSGRKLQGSA